MRHDDQRTAAASTKGRRRRLLAERDDDQLLQSRPGEAVFELRLQRSRPTSDGSLGAVWPRQRVAKPAGLRRAAVWSAWPARWQFTLVEWILADVVSRRSLPQQ